MVISKVYLEGLYGIWGWRAKGKTQEQHHRLIKTTRYAHSRSDEVISPQNTWNGLLPIPRGSLDSPEPVGKERDEGEGEEQRALHLSFWPWPLWLKVEKQARSKEQEPKQKPEEQGARSKSQEGKRHKASDSGRRDCDGPSSYGSRHACSSPVDTRPGGREGGS
jgi:hypothetical protein